jgi:hypothetical protein
VGSCRLRVEGHDRTAVPTLFTLRSGNSDLRRELSVVVIEPQPRKMRCVEAQRDQPPSTFQAVPVTNRASVRARNATTSAMS